MNISLEYYKIFYYVGKLGQITQAARILSISQPAVSQAMKHLEEELNTKLFVRTPKGITLTNEGNILHEYIAKGYETILLGEEKLLQMKNLESGEIHIGASDMTLRFYLLPYLEKFHEQHPGIKVSVTNAPTPETLRYLEEGRIDFGVVSTPLPDGNGFSSRPVREIRDIFVAGSRFSYLKGQTLDCATLSSLPLICLEENTSSRRGMDEWMQREHVKPQLEFELATSDMIVQFAARNLGIGCVMQDFALEYLKNGTLFALTLASPVPPRHFCIVTARSRYISPAASRLLEML
ncbi:MAG: LysR family transcriptional regulator [Eubacteriales bacterium]|nr:LysR family transcriptional regulator [Eubacteriales bacterium]